MTSWPTTFLHYLQSGQGGVNISLSDFSWIVAEQDCLLKSVKLYLFKQQFLALASKIFNKTYRSKVKPVVYITVILLQHFYLWYRF